MPTLTQANRPMRLETPLGPDKLLLLGLRGSESISALFRFDLDLIAERTTDVAFDQLLGQNIGVTVDIPGGKRHFHGICKRISAGRRDLEFQHLRMEVVPQFWLLTRREQSRIFQQLSVPDILKNVLDGLNVRYDIRGTFEPRDYCVQYRESDFAFASRLMEEEGIYYFFEHAAGNHTLVLSNTPAGHPAVPGAAKAIYEEVVGGVRDDLRVWSWEKSQEIRSGKVTLWDHCFELPHQHLDADKELMASAQVGKTTHKLQLNGVTDGLELYDYPGAYAQRFDGVDPGGGDRAGDLEKIFQDNARTAELRIQEEQARALKISASGNCAQLTSGHKFTLERHFDADGDYMVLSVEHSGALAADYRSGEGDRLVYENKFTCIPLSVPFRPPRATAKPTVRGTQTAVVVGPAGEEIFTDKYGRIKVQFHWDRHGKNDANSSCWIRVATPWAGKQWGMIHIPRIGQEVVVDFLEGDPDQPIVVGSVFNAEQMPPFALPDQKNLSGFRSNSSLGGGGLNEMSFDDTKGAERIYMHGQFNMDTVIQNNQTTTIHNSRTDVIDVDDSETVGSNQTISIGADQSITVGANRTISVGANHSETIGSNMSINVGSSLSETVAINYSETVGAAMELTVGGLMTQTIGAVYALSVGAAMTESVGAVKSSSIGGSYKVTVGGKHNLTVGSTVGMKSGGKWGNEAGGPYSIKAPKIILEGKDQIMLKCGGASITLKSGGEITIKGSNITLKGSGKIAAKAGGDVILKGSTIKEN